MSVADLGVSLLEKGLAVERLQRETHVLYLPDELVGVGFPGNPKRSKDAKAAGAGVGLDGHRRSSQYTLWLMGPLRLSPRVEWCARAGVATALSLLLALHRLAPAFLHQSVWLVVLSLACAKPTLGDTLEAWWLAVSGGMIGVLLSILLAPVAVHGQAACTSCAAKPQNRMRTKKKCPANPFLMQRAHTCIYL